MIFTVKLQGRLYNKLMERKIKNNILTIMKKECTRIVSDRKLFFAAVLMPGILLGIMYYLIGNLMGDMFAVEDDYIYQIHAVNMPPSISAVISPEILSS